MLGLGFGNAGRNSISFGLTKLTRWNRYSIRPQFICCMLLDMVIFPSNESHAQFRHSMDGVIIVPRLDGEI